MHELSYLPCIFQWEDSAIKGIIQRYHRGGWEMNCQLLSISIKSSILFQTYYSHLQSFSL